MVISAQSLNKAKLHVATTYDPFKNKIYRLHEYLFETIEIVGEFKTSTLLPPITAVSKRRSKQAHPCNTNKNNATSQTLRTPGHSAQLRNVANSYLGIHAHVALQSKGSGALGDKFQQI